MVFFESLEEVVRVIRSIVVNNVGRIVTINFVDMISKLAARLSLDFLDLLEAATLDEGPLGF